jgi:Domain of unknown function (DUF1707)
VTCAWSIFYRVTNRPAPRDLRASDADRERIIALLGEAAADGRLTPEEHAERAEQAWQARTLGQLAVLTTDLVEPTAQPIRLDGRRTVTGVFGRDSREGRWVVPESLPVLSVFGEVELDLREALLQSARTVVYATVIGGTLHLIVPEGVVVEMSGTAVLTRKISRSYRQPGSPGGAAKGSAAKGSAAKGSAANPGGPDGLSDSGQPVIDLRTVAFGGTIKVTAPKRARRIGGLRRGGLPR